MDFFCLRKPCHAREKHHRKEAKKHEEKTPIIRLEARPRRNPATNTERDKRAHRRPGTMAHPFTNLPDGELPALNMNRPFHPTICNRVEDEHHLHVPQRQAQQNPQQLNQILVYPHSSRQYRFLVVDHSIICHGPGHASDPHPVCSVALVPEVAAVRDIVDTLSHRPGLTVMARLHSGRLVRIRTFMSTRALSEATLQLEVRNHDDDDIDNGYMAEMAELERLVG